MFVNDLFDCCYTETIVIDFSDCDFYFRRRYDDMTKAEREIIDKERICEILPNNDLMYCFLYPTSEKHEEFKELVKKERNERNVQ